MSLNRREIGPREALLQIRTLFSCENLVQGQAAPSKRHRSKFQEYSSPPQDRQVTRPLRTTTSQHGKLYDQAKARSPNLVDIHQVPEVQQHRSKPLAGLSTYRAQLYPSSFHPPPPYEQLEHQQHWPAPKAPVSQSTDQCTHNCKTEAHGLGFRA